MRTIALMLTLLIGTILAGAVLLGSLSEQTRSCTEDRTVLSAQVAELQRTIAALRVEIEAERRVIEELRAVRTIGSSEPAATPTLPDWLTPLTSPFGLLMVLTTTVSSSGAGVLAVRWVRGRQSGRVTVSMSRAQATAYEAWLRGRG